MTRDFFKFLANENDEATYILALGSNQQVFQKGKFCKAANRAYELAKQAETSYTQGHHFTAVGHWSSIYGPKFKLI